MPASRATTLGAAPERRALARPLTVKASPEGLRIEGYASLFSVPDLAKDVVMPGAFRGSLARRGAGGVRLLWQHDPRHVIGRWEAIAEDARGLLVCGRLDDAVAKAREVAALLASGAVDGLSIGFATERADRDPARGLRRLWAVDLWEVSIVTFPMLPGARVVRAEPAPAGRTLPAADPLAATLRAAARGLAMAR